jgi:hypothetical protein
MEVEFRLNPSSGSRADSYGRTDGHRLTDINEANRLYSLLTLASLKMDLKRDRMG